MQRTLPYRQQRHFGTQLFRQNCFASSRVLFGPVMPKEKAGAFWETEETIQCMRGEALIDFLRLWTPEPFWVLTVVALLLDGRLEDWLRNPQYVLEDVTRRTAQMRYGTFEDVCCFGTGHLVRMAKRLQRYWNDWVARTWTANVQFSQDPNLCKSQSRLHCGRVFAGNTAWQHVVLWEADPSEPTSGLRLQPI
ncbi:unnamed protein product [Durusdinium trenchii]|uniref:Uncharacterized protein n=1 Tax=Durusdinium trenchii TaxID=1381693 RepID=A0ABP0KNL7_9DINO